MERKLASVRRIDKIEPIKGADKIVKATVGGWEIVTSINDRFKEGDLVVYLEIDSWVPTTLAPYLSKGKEPREFNGVKGERLRTIKLRGQISQGLILPIGKEALKEGIDVTEFLGIQKWERPMNAQLAGIAKGNFPSFIPKTDQERVQNLSRELGEWTDRELTFEVSEKLEGSSMTVYLNDDEFGVCSRNINLKETEGNAFWAVARTLNLEDKMRVKGMNLALQGELIGPGIQGNIYKLTQPEFVLYDVFDIDAQKYLTPGNRQALFGWVGIKHVPIVADDMTLVNMNEMLSFAEGTSLLYNTEREGVVFKCNQTPSISFKVISNSYLMGEQ